MLENINTITWLVSIYIIISILFLASYYDDIRDDIDNDALTNLICILMIILWPLMMVFAIILAIMDDSFNRDDLYTEEKGD